MLNKCYITLNNTLTNLLSAPKLVFLKLLLNSVESSVNYIINSLNISNAYFNTKIASNSF